MKVFVASLATALTVAGGAGAYVSAVTPREFAALTSQVTLLKTQVAALQTQARLVSDARITADETAFIGLHNYALCQDGVIWDSISQTWYAMHAQVGALRASAPSWPDFAVNPGSAGKSSFDDQGACQALGIVRPATIIVTPPSP